MNPLDQMAAVLIGTVGIPAAVGGVLTVVYCLRQLAIAIAMALNS